MSRTLRFAPLALLLAIIAALVWRLATPADTSIHSTLDEKRVPPFELAQFFLASLRSRPPIWRRALPIS